MHVSLLATLENSLHRTRGTRLSISQTAKCIVNFLSTDKSCTGRWQVIQHEDSRCIHLRCTLAQKRAPTLPQDRVPFVSFSARAGLCAPSSCNLHQQFSTKKSRHAQLIAAISDRCRQPNQPSERPRREAQGRKSHNHFTK